MPVLLGWITVLIAAVLVWLANSLALRPWRRAGSAHWTERARLLWPARVGAVWNVILAGLLAAALAGVLGQDAAPAWYVRILAGLAGALAGSYGLDRAVYPGFTLGEWLRHLLGNWGMQLMLGAVFIAALVGMPPDWSPQTFGFAGAALALQLALRLKVGELVLRGLGVLRPAEAPLRDLVQAVSEELRTPVRAVRVLSGPLAQAYALPVNGEVWISRRLLEICTEAELRAVMAHELAHLGESRLTVLGRVAGTMVWWPLVFARPVLYSYEFMGLAALFALCLLLGRAVRGMSQRLERRADGIAAKAQMQEGVYASALEKLYRENQLPAVNPKGVRTHPSLYDRLTAAGQVPDYARPQPPGRLAWPSLALLALLVSMGVAQAFSHRERVEDDSWPWIPEAKAHSFKPPGV